MAIPKATGPETVEQQFARWLSDGTTWIGVFENADLGHRDIGRRVALPYAADVLAGAEVGVTRAPDHASIGLGWRYLLVAKVSTAVEAIAWLERREVRS